MDYHQRALNIQKTGSGLAKAMTAETCVLMGMVRSKVGDFKGALDVRLSITVLHVIYPSVVIYLERRCFPHNSYMKTRRLYFKMHLAKITYLIGKQKHRWGPFTLNFRTTKRRWRFC